MKSDILFDIDYKQNNGLEEKPDTMTSGRATEIKNTMILEQHDILCLMITLNFTLR